MTTTPPGTPVQQVVDRVAGRLRYPWVLALLATALAVDLVIPDPIPFVDELVLALLTVLFGTWRTRRNPEPPANPGPGL